MSGINSDYNIDNTAIQQQTLDALDNVEGEYKDAEAQISSLNTKITELNNEIAENEAILNNYTDDMLGKRDMLNKQKKILEDKMRLMRTRDRMLQLSIEKNVYKRKVIYTLVAMILGIIILMIAGYVAFNRA
jgi:peptidoglycan hydrolase CwlO-like protein